jgi:hypothetical protein
MLFLLVHVVIYHANAILSIFFVLLLLLFDFRKFVQVFKKKEKNIYNHLFENKINKDLVK